MQTERLLGHSKAYLICILGGMPRLPWLRVAPRAGKGILYAHLAFPRPY